MVMGAVLDLVRVLFEPSAVFERVREKPRFLAPFVALAFAIVLIGVVQLPYTKAAMSAQFSQMPNMTPEAAQRALSFVSIGVGFGPVVYALILVINALLLWVVVSVVGGEAKFGTLLSVTTYASMSYILLTLVGLAVLRMRGTEQIAGMEDLQPALGLDLLAPGAKGLTLALLRGINPFSLYGIFLTATGISVTHKTSKGSAYTAAIVQLLVTLLVTGVLSGMRGGR
ncbi:MAG: hypothetical protein AUI13_18265 [Gemmatimonadetes bacterium 13_2_20CM_2_69_23]|nr:MAG: hypothetical protein AUI13_18265 [Gemmatimonadetes bacterium 13_2_20CM_2_69_23]